MYIWKLVVIGIQDQYLHFNRGRPYAVNFAENWVLDIHISYDKEFYVLAKATPFSGYYVC